MVQFDVLQTSKQHLLFSNSSSTGLKGNVGSSGLTYAISFSITMWCGTKDVLVDLSAKDTISVCPGNTLTLMVLKFAV